MSGASLKFQSVPNAASLGQADRSKLSKWLTLAARQSGSVLGVALFGSLVGQSNAFVAGAHAALIISAGLLLAAGAVIWRGASTRKNGGAPQLKS